MNDTTDQTGPISVHTENWEKYKERWYETADLHDSGDVAGAVFQLKRMANEGFTPALAELGDKYEFGGGEIEADLAEAVDWYKKSVEASNDVRSHIGLARIYLQSKELDPDRCLSFNHLKVLADSDVMPGWFGLGLLYQHGIGIDVDLEEAETCFRKAAEKGHLVAGTHLAQVLMEQDKPGWLKTAIRFIPRVLWFRTFRPHDPRLGFVYVPTAEES